MTLGVKPYTGVDKQDIKTADETIVAIVAMQAALDARLATIDGRVDGVETLIGATNTALGTLNTAMTTQNTYLDTVETLIGATNTALATQNGYLDGVESKLDAQTALLSATDPAVVVSLTKIVSQTFTRPADAAAYLVGDLIANSTTAGSVAPMQFAAARINAGTGNIRRARILSSAVTDANQQLRLHLFRNAPTSTVGDNGVFAGSMNGVAALYMGALDVTLDSTYSDGVAGIALPRMGGEISFETDTASMLIYGVIEARTAFTPTTGAVYTVRLEVFRD